MVDIASPAPTPAPARPTEGRPSRGPGRHWFPQLLLRLHFLAGVAVGPFILVAALSGAAYAAAPTVEHVVYRHELTTASRGPALPLADQVATAERYLAPRHPSDRLTGVRPAASTGETTQVMFEEPGLMEYQTRSVWIDPATARPHGDLLVYDTALPITTWLDVFHRTLFLGDVGRAYSELAASWLGITALAGIGLWIARWRRSDRRRRRALVVPRRGGGGYRRLLSWHAATGLWVLVAALFLSATGITWSLHAGANVDALQSALDWSTPSLTTAAPDARTPSADGSAERRGDDLTRIDDVLAAARAVNIRAAEVEVDLPTAPGEAWTVEETRREHPTAVSSVAIDGRTLRTVSRTDWDRYPLGAKLTRWGIDTHMGLMWGVANRVALVAAALGIAAMVVLGYLMWWRRRPARGGRVLGAVPSRGALARAPWWGRGLVLAAGAALGLALPELGVSLVVFVLLDALLEGRRDARARATPAETTVGR